VESMAAGAVVQAAGPQRRRRRGGSLTPKASLQPLITFFS
jgi:hypothetical protein